MTVQVSLCLFGVNEVKVKKKKVRYYIVLERALCRTAITQTPVLLVHEDTSLLVTAHRFHTDPHYTNTRLELKPGTLSTIFGVIDHLPLLRCDICGRGYNLLVEQEEMMEKMGTARVRERKRDEVLPQQQQQQQQRQQQLQQPHQLHEPELVGLREAGVVVVGAAQLQQQHLQQQHDPEVVERDDAGVAGVGAELPHPQPPQQHTVSGRPTGGTGNIGAFEGAVPTVYTSNMSSE